MNGVQTTNSRYNKNTKGRGCGILNVEKYLEMKAAASHRGNIVKTSVAIPPQITKHKVGGRGRILRENCVTVGLNLETFKPSGSISNVSAAEQTFQCMPHIIQKILSYIPSGFDKINFINAYPNQRHQYQHIVNELIAHKSEDPLFF